MGLARYFVQRAAEYGLSGLLSDERVVSAPSAQTGSVEAPLPEDIQSVMESASGRGPVIIEAMHRASKHSIARVTSSRQLSELEGYLEALFRPSWCESNFTDALRLMEELAQEFAAILGEKGVVDAVEECVQRETRDSLRQFASEQLREFEVLKAKLGGYSQIDQRFIRASPQFLQYIEGVTILAEINEEDYLSVAPKPSGPLGPNRHLCLGPGHSLRAFLVLADDETLGVCGLCQQVYLKQRPEQTASLYCRNVLRRAGAAYRLGSSGD